MKIIVFGSKGMLGEAVLRELYDAGHTPVPYSHAECDIGNRSDVRIAVGLAKAHAAINCAGVTPGKSVSAMALANAAGPHLIADHFSGRLIHVSTDCVFSGKPDPQRDRYTSKDQPAPNDPYGRTKLAGEPARDNVIVVRTSFVGPESGLLAWLLSKKEGETIEGWRRAFWTGSTSIAVARALVEFATMDLPTTAGIAIHLATENRLSKYDVLRLCAEVFGLKVTITPVDTPHIDRALAPDVVLESLDKSLPRLVERWKK